MRPKREVSTFKAEASEARAHRAPFIRHRPPIERHEIGFVSPILARSHEYLAIAYIFIELWITALGGPYKWGLVRAHVEPLNTLQDVGAFAIVALGFINWALSRRIISNLALVLSWLVITQFVNGVIQNGPIAAVVGLKVILPIIIGYMAAEFLSSSERLEKMQRHLIIIFFITAIGVFVDYKIDYPWHGLQYENFGVTNSVSRQWWSGGVERIAGFTASSATAATIMVMGTWAAMIRYKHIVARAAVLIVAFAVVWLTTTKTLIALLPVFGIASLLPVEKRSRLVAGFGRFWVVVSAAALCASVLTGKAHYDIANRGDLSQAGADTSNTLSWRYEVTWPMALTTVGAARSITGEGIGSAGLPNLLYSLVWLGPLDNFLLWLVINFGILGVLIILVPFFENSVLPVELGLYEGLAAVILSYGMTVTLVETRLNAVILGIYLGLLALLKRRSHNTHLRWKLDPGGLKRETL